MERVGSAIEAVQSLIAQTRLPSKVIVVFDPTPRLEDALRERLPDGVSLLENQWQSGLSNARNTGLFAATTDLVAFLDDDAVATPDWLERIEACFENADVVGAGGQAIPLWLEASGRPWWLPPELDWAVGCTFPNFGDGKRYVRNVLGNNMCFRRDPLSRIHGFHPAVGGPISGDDTEVCLRLLQLDPSYRIVYATEAAVHHKVPRGRQTVRYLIHSAWDQGAGKATIKRLHAGSKRALSSESSYLTYLARRFLPARAKALVRGQWREGVWVGVAGLAVASVLYGYGTTRLRDALRRRGTVAPVDARR